MFPAVLGNNPEKISVFIEGHPMRTGEDRQCCGGGLYETYGIHNFRCRSEEDCPDDSTREWS